MVHRQRRSWSTEEDQLLRDAVEKEDPGNPNPSRWHAIAKHVPDRTNKDCRKRWVSNIASDVAKGGWTTEEDEKLTSAIEKYGTRWSMVASVVQSRNSDQCAKRWRDTLNPAIDRTNWSAEADEMLLNAVKQHGKLWTKIVKLYFPGRTGLSAKNRYNSITRSAETRGSRRQNGTVRRRAVERVFSVSANTSPSTRSSSISLSNDDASSPSSSSSASGSPVTPTMMLPPPVRRKLSFSSSNPLIANADLVTDSNPDISDLLAGVPLDLNMEHASTPSSLSDSDELSLDSFLHDDLMSAFNSPSPFSTDLLMSDPLPDLQNTDLSSLHIPPFPFDNNTPNLFSQERAILPQPRSLDPTSNSSPFSSTDISSIAPSDLFMPSGNVASQDKEFLESRESVLMRLDTLENMQQKLETQEITLKAQRAALNRIAMVCKMRGEEEFARRYLKEAKRRKVELSLVFEQQESINDHITSLCGQLERGFHQVQSVPVSEISQ
ncbi:hypothetical protein VKT23_006773 [Stygiomarasmius scandens]|uniref:Uncharacterized protein n=1 Tax=Marasmiellus scandens TaxID=2682957 RepID=A0ABR1JRD9_9AGAR